MTKQEEIYTLIKHKKSIKGSEIKKMYGTYGSVDGVLQRMVLKGKISSRRCECGNCIYYEIKK